MQAIKDILATIIIFLILGAVVAGAFVFALLWIPVITAGIIWCYVKDERSCKRLG